MMIEVRCSTCANEGIQSRLGVLYVTAEAPYDGQMKRALRLAGGHRHATVTINEHE